MSLSGGGDQDEQLLAGGAVAQGGVDLVQGQQAVLVLDLRGPAQALVGGVLWAEVVAARLLPLGVVLCAA